MAKLLIKLLKHLNNTSMRSLKTMSFILFLLIPFLAFTGCSNDDDITLDGELYLTFVNTSDDLHVVIYSMQNTQVSLFDIPLNTYKKHASQSLNVGNYLIQLKSSYYNYGTTAVQIQQGKRTSVTYDEQNNAHTSIN